MIEVGQVIGNWRVERMLGQGGMGAVFEAVHQEIGRRAAIKVLHPQFSQNPEIGTRFLNEARAASVIEHLGVVEIFEFSRLPDGTTYIVMEFLRGQPLTKRLEGTGGSLGPDALRLARQIASVLAAAHDKGIVHRDLKPDNVMIVPDPEAPGGERAKVLDFGIAKVADEYQKPGSEHVKTHAGMLLGTPAYMSPEQCKGAAEVDAKSDVYSLGVMLYQMLTGRLPFAAQGLGELMAMQMYNQPTPARQIEPSISAELERLVDTMMAKAPAERPAMSQIVSELERLGAARTGVLHVAVEEPLPHKKTLVLDDPSIPNNPTIRKPEGPPVSVPTHTPPPVTPLGTGPGRIILAAVALGLIGGSGIGAMLLSKRHRQQRVEPKPLPKPPERQHPEPKPVPEAPRTRPAPVGMVYLHGGSFRMGSTPTEIGDALALCQRSGTGCKRDLFEREQPVRQVTVSEFFLDASEVTNEQFATWLNRQSDYKVDRKGRFVKDGDDLIADLHPAHSGIAYRRSHAGFSARDGYERKPVAQISWTAAARYCTAQGGRLPTEAEWEFAAREKGGRFPWGNDEPGCADVVYGRGPGQPCASAGSGPADVGTSRGDRLPGGLSDLGGNVAEWVQDRFVAPYPACPPPCKDPVVKDDAGGPPMLRVIRGGDWGQTLDACRSAGRSRAAQDQVQINVGFRCARPVKAQKAEEE